MPGTRACWAVHMTNLPASRTALLRQMYEAFNAQDLDALIPAALAPDVNWPNLLDHTRAHGHEEVRAYWARQFAVTHPLVRLEALRPDPDGHRIIATVLPARETSRATTGPSRPSNTSTPSATTARCAEWTSAPPDPPTKYLFLGTPSELVGFYPSPLIRDEHAPVAQGIEQRPPEPCAQVRILPGALRSKCPRPRKQRRR